MSISPSPRPDQHEESVSGKESVGRQTFGFKGYVEGQADPRGFEEIVRKRRSVRGFLPIPLAPDVLREIFVTASLAPSNCNTQPWLVYVASGQRLEGLRKRLMQTVRDGKRTQDFPDRFDSYPLGVWYDRSFDAAVRLYSAMNIQRHEKEKRLQAVMRNFEFFGAPHVAFLCLPDWAAEREAFDLGIYAQTLMLSMISHGVASCPQGALGLYVQPIKEALNIPENHKLMLGISFGTEDHSSAANEVRIPRAPLGVTTFFLSD